MPVLPEELIRTPEEPILDDRKCAGCGYNLRGLRTSSKCPECGRPIRNRPARRFADQMMQAPFPWIRQYARGTFALFTGGYLMIIGLLAWAFFRHPGWGAAAIVGAAIWIVGVWITAGPRPKTKAMMIDPFQEWRWMRIWARASQPFWIPAIALGLAAHVVGSASLLYLLPAFACALVGIFGVWPLMALQSNLAHWAADTSLAALLRIVSWSFGIGLAIATVVASLGGDVRAGISGIGRTPFGPLGTLGGYAALLCGGLIITAVTGPVLFALWRLWRMAHWVTLHYLTREMKDERLRRQARRAVPPAPQRAHSHSG